MGYYKSKIKAHKGQTLRKDPKTKNHLIRDRDVGRLPIFWSII